MISGSSSKSGCCGPISWKWALVLVLIAVIVGAFLSSCTPPTVGRPKYSATGTASWYGPGFQGRRTASGERYDQQDLTAAHRSLPFGTKVRVINLHNNREVVVRINDRGPFVRGRIIDVSKKAAMMLAMLGSGTAKVRVETLETIEMTPPRRPRIGYKRIPRVAHK